jgi:hypothetical protein
VPRTGRVLELGVVAQKPAPKLAAKSAGAGEVTGARAAQHPGASARALPRTDKWFDVVQR